MNTTSKESGADGRINLGFRRLVISHVENAGSFYAYKEEEAGGMAVMEKMTEQVGNMAGVMAEKVANMPRVMAEQCANMPGVMAEKVANMPGVMAEQVANMPGVMAEQCANMLGVMAEQCANMPRVMAEQVANMPGVVAEQCANMPRVVAQQCANMPGVMAEQVATMPGVVNAPQEGSMYGAFHSGRWFRAQVEQICLNDDKVRVRMVDYGWNHFVKVSELRQLPKSLLEAKITCEKYKMADMKPRGRYEGYSAEDRVKGKVWLEKIIGGRVVEAECHILVKYGGGIQVECKIGDLNLNEAALESGHVILLKDRNNNKREGVKDGNKGINRETSCVEDINDFEEINDFVYWF